MATNSRESSCEVRAFAFLAILGFLVVPIQSSGQTDNLPGNREARKPTIEPLVTTAVEHYEIRGGSFDDLRRELDAKGHGAAGTTTGSVTYRFKSEKSDGKCKIQDVRAECSAKIRLPRWYDMNKAPIPMQEFWIQAYSKLRKHEMGHVDICVEVAKDVEKALWATPVSQHCPHVNQEARARADAVVRGMNARQLAYDEREYGGASKQGQSKASVSN